MTKFLNKLFLCGILLNSVNYELAYSTAATEATNTPDATRLPEPFFSSELVKPSTPGQFNIAVDLENNMGSTNNRLDSDMEIKCNQTIGEYDTSKYEIKDDILYSKTLYSKKVEKEFCELDKEAGDYSIFKQKQMQTFSDL